MRSLQELLKIVSTALVLLGLAACSIAVNRRDHVDKPDPVLVIYHVKPGKEIVLEDLLKKAWLIYRKEHLVCAQPHVCMRVKEDEGHTRLIEMFAWVGPFAVEYPPDSIKPVWVQIESCCEDRQGNLGMEVRSAEMIMPPEKVGSLK